MRNWNNAKIKKPKKNGFYWCYVRRVEGIDSRVIEFQESVEFSVECNKFGLLSGEVIAWTELMRKPNFDKSFWGML